MTFNASFPQTIVPIRIFSKSKPTPIQYSYPLIYLLNGELNFFLASEYLYAKIFTRRATIVKSQQIIYRIDLLPG